MRGIDPRVARVRGGSPKWGFISERLLAHMSLTHGPPFLRTVCGHQLYPSTRSLAYGGYKAITGCRWGAPMFRYLNDEGAGFTSHGDVMSFPQYNKPWAKLEPYNTTLAFICRVGGPGSIYERRALGFQINPSLQFTFQWKNAYSWTNWMILSGVPQNPIILNHPVGSIWYKWFGVVMTLAYRTQKRRFYAGLCDGSWFGAGLSMYGTTNMIRPHNVSYSIIDGKPRNAWNGEVGGFLWTKGVWAQDQVRQWMANPFAWITDFGQKLPPVHGCVIGDSCTELAIDADVSLDLAGAADAGTELALDADVDLDEALLGDACLELAMDADAHICPEEDYE